MNIHINTPNPGGSQTAEPAGMQQFQQLTTLDAPLAETFQMAVLAQDTIENVLDRTQVEAPKGYFSFIMTYEQFNQIHFVANMVRILAEAAYGQYDKVLKSNCAGGTH